MSKHHRRRAGPTLDKPIIWCLWIDKPLGVWVRSTLSRKGFLSNDYEHVYLSDVFVRQ